MCRDGSLYAATCHHGGYSNDPGQSRYDKWHQPTEERLSCCLQYAPYVLITAGVAGRDADSQTPELATLLQLTAWETVQEYYGVKY